MSLKLTASGAFKDAQRWSTIAKVIVVLGLLLSLLMSWLAHVRPGCPGVLCINAQWGSLLLVTIAIWLVWVTVSLPLFAVASAIRSVGRLAEALHERAVP